MAVLEWVQVPGPNEGEGAYGPLVRHTIWKYPSLYALRIRQTRDRCLRSFRERGAACTPGPSLEEFPNRRLCLGILCEEHKSGRNIDRYGVFC